jgi:hypothetical protein
VTARWGIADPAAVDGDDAMKRRAFLCAYGELAAFRFFSACRWKSSIERP